MKKRVENLIDRRKKVYQESQRLAHLADDGDRNFFKNTKNYMSKQRPTPFDVTKMFPGLTEQQVSERLAHNFNSISGKFPPLVPEHVPVMYDKNLPQLQPHEVSVRLKKFKKPKSIVRGDIFPELVTLYSDFLVIPLTSIYNEITASNVWPEAWKRESVTIIPKTRVPDDVGDLRNISCTLLASKLYESYVLEWALQEVNLEPNQFGGTKGCSTTLLIISIWQKVLSDLEDCKAGTVLTSINSKAFNRMSYQECLLAVKWHGASTQVISLIACFLTGRTMSIKVGSSWSVPRPVNGGDPQGSILGVLLFNITTDELEDTQQLEGQDDLRADDNEIDDHDTENGPEYHSTPTGENFLEYEPGVTPFRMGSSQFVFLEEARNVRRSLDYNRTSEKPPSHMSQTPEPLQYGKADRQAA